MSSKTLHGVTLWAVPRFHRSEIARQPISHGSIVTESSETGTQWVNRLKTYSFTLGQDEAKPPASRPDIPEKCH
jgi:hypothetical protein